MKRIREVLLLLILVVSCTFSVPAIQASAAEKIPPVRRGERVQAVQVLQWTVILRRKISVKVKGKKYVYKAGTRVRCVNGFALNNKCTLLLKNRYVNVPRTYVLFYRDLCTIKKGDYNTTTKLNFVNRPKRRSRTKYLIWVCLSKQRVNVYYGSVGKWKLTRVMKCSTGAGNRTPVGTFRVKWKKPYAKGCRYYTEFAGSGFHVWPGNYGGMNRTLGYSTASHGCVRLSYNDAVWIYNRIPVNTTVLIW